MSFSTRLLMPAARFLLKIHGLISKQIQSEPLMLRNLHRMLGLSALFTYLRHRCMAHRNVSPWMRIIRQDHSCLMGRQSFQEKSPACRSIVAEVCLLWWADRFAFMAPARTP